MRRLLTATAALALGVGIATAQPATIQGAAGTPLFDAGTIAAWHDAGYTWTFARGAAKVVAVATGDVDLYVYNSRGKLVAKDTGPDGCPVAKWTVSRADRFTVLIINESPAPVDVAISSN